VGSSECVRDRECDPGDGKPILSLHGLRHTGASQALARGVPLIVVCRQLGHSRIKTTSDAYAHLINDAQLDTFAAGIGGNLRDAGLRRGLRRARANARTRIVTRERRA
jgi:integrase